MTTDTSVNTEETSGDDDDDDDDDEATEGGKSKTPRHMRYAHNIRVVSGRLVKREAGKAVGMRTWIDNAAARVTDPDVKARLETAGRALDAAYASAIAAAEALEALPATGVGRKKSDSSDDASTPIEVGAIVQIAPKFRESYSGIFEIFENIKITGIRKNFVTISAPGKDGEAENFVIPMKHLKLQSPASPAAE